MDTSTVSMRDAPGLPLPAEGDDGVAKDFPMCNELNSAQFRKIEHTYGVSNAVRGPSIRRIPKHGLMKPNALVKCGIRLWADEGPKETSLPSIRTLLESAFSQSDWGGYNPRLEVNTQVPLMPSRDRSPYHRTSALSPKLRFGTASHMREQQKAENDARELQKQLERKFSEQAEPKTISPKDVDLVYDESDHDPGTPLFPPHQFSQGYHRFYLQQPVKNPCITEHRSPQMPASKTCSKKDGTYFYASLPDFTLLYEGVGAHCSRTRKQGHLRENAIAAADAKAHIYCTGLLEITPSKHSTLIEGVSQGGGGDKRSYVGNGGVNYIGHLSSNCQSLPNGNITSPENLVPNSPQSQPAIPFVVPPSNSGDPPLSSQDGHPVQMNHPVESPPIRPLPDTELRGPFLGEPEAPPPPERQIEHNITARTGEERPAPQSILLLPLCGIAILLGPVNIVSGMTASHGDNWKLAFVG